MGKRVNRTELGAIFGVSQTAIASWLREGLPRVETDGKHPMYDTSDCIEWYVRRKLNIASAVPGPEAGDESGGDGQTINQAFEQARLTRERADAQELKNKILRREYVPIGVVSTVIAKVAVQMAGSLDALPLTIKRRVPELSMNGIDLVKRSVVDCQNSLADLDGKIESAVTEAMKDTQHAVQD